MSDFTVHVTLELQMDLAITPDELEAALDRVMQHLEEADAPDPSVGASLTNRKVTVELTFETDDVQGAVTRALGYLTAAFEAAGLRLPGKKVEEISAKRELVTV